MYMLYILDKLLIEVEYYTLYLSNFNIIVISYNTTISTTPTPPPPLLHSCYHFLPEMPHHRVLLADVSGIVQAVETLPHVTQVLQPFPCPGQDVPLTVDVVCNHGYTWVKVVARNAQALHLTWAG